MAMGLDISTSVRIFSKGIWQKGGFEDSEQHEQTSQGLSALVSSRQGPQSGEGDSRAGLVAPNLVGSNANRDNTKSRSIATAPMLIIFPFGSSTAPETLPQLSPQAGRFLPCGSAHLQLARRGRKYGYNGL
jgi:hypothetical protein